MHPHRRLRPFGLVSSAVASAILAGTLVAGPAVANPQGTNVIINEVCLKAGSANAVFDKKFVELYYPSDVPVALENWSLQYRPATSTVAPVTSGTAPLSGTVPAKGQSQRLGQTCLSRAIPAIDHSSLTKYTGRASPERSLT